MVTLLCLALPGCGSNEPEAVRTCYEDYVQAELARDGSKAVMLVSQSTKDFFGAIRELAIEAGPEQIRARPFCDRMFITMIRHRMDLNYVKQLTGEQLYMVGIRDGWLTAKSPGEGVSLENIEVDGDTARADLVVRGETLPFKIEFVKEQGQWKMDPTPSFRELENIMSKALEGRNVDLDQIVMLGIAKTTGKPVSPTIWDKPKLQ
jgi:hypothetical protein